MFLPGGEPNKLYPGQSQVQVAMVVLAGISLPWMLAKPCVEYCIHTPECCPSLKTAPPKKRESTIMDAGEERDRDTVDMVNLKPQRKENEESSSASLEEDNNNKVEKVATPKSKPDDLEEEEFQFSEVCIHNLLETIEFVLGSVSHTASYLRLWALSLAHSELATVFWDKMMFGIGFDITLSSHWVITGILGFLAFSAWFGITLAVMMFMELLSALLHALRLHWVEFQSKFYKGDGTPFKPFSLRKIHGTKNVMHLALKAH